MKQLHQMVMGAGLAAALLLAALLVPAARQGVPADAGEDSLTWGELVRALNEEAFGELSPEVQRQLNGLELTVDAETGEFVPALPEELQQEVARAFAGEGYEEYAITFGSLYEAEK